MMLRNASGRTAGFTVARCTTTHRPEAHAAVRGTARCSAARQPKPCDTSSTTLGGASSQLLACALGEHRGPQRVFPAASGRLSSSAQQTTLPRRGSRSSGAA